jgi:hypothetical protein
MKYTIHAELGHNEARKICDALAYSRFRARCECEDDVGYVCGMCQRSETAPYDLDDLLNEYSDWLFTHLARKEEPKP